MKIFFVSFLYCIASLCAQQPFGQGVGLVVKFTQGEPLTAIDDLKELGVKWVRDGVDWEQMELTPGNYLTAFPPTFQTRLDFYKANGISVIYVLTLENPVAYPNSTANPHNSTDAVAFGKFAEVVAKLLKASGIPFVLELGNEPHNFKLGPL